MTLWLLSALGWLRKAAGAALDLARHYPLQAALIASLCLSGWLWHGKGKAEAERDAAWGEIAALIEAQREAEAKARKARADTEKLSKELAHATDQYAADLDAISRRALAGRVRAKAGRCPASGTVAAALPDSAEVDPGTDTGGVYFSIAEADLLRRHEVRSVTCQAWARGLIAEGLAVGE
jgi:hypothetical protein